MKNDILKNSISLALDTNDGKVCSSNSSKVDYETLLGLIVKTEPADAGYEQNTKQSAIEQSEYILPDFGTSESDAFKVHVKIEPIDENTMLQTTDTNTEFTCDFVLPDKVVKFETANLQLSSATSVVDDLENTQFEMIFEDHGSTLHQDSTLQPTFNILDARIKNEPLEDKTTVTIKNELMFNDHNSYYDSEIGKNLLTCAVPFNCSKCNKYFDSEAQLTSHLLTYRSIKHHSSCQNGKHSVRQQFSSSKKHKCSLCELTFASKQGLKRHSWIHSRKRIFKCVFCEKVFPMNSKLTKHLTIHSGLKPFKCDQCGSAFKRNSHLNRHMFIHKNEKQYRCKYCRKEFRFNSSLKRHLLVHSGEKRHKCTECGRAFSEKSNLNQHLRIHTGEKPYSCTQCEMSFSQKTYLTKHMSSHLLK